MFTKITTGLPRLSKFNPNLTTLRYIQGSGNPGSGVGKGGGGGGSIRESGGGLGEYGVAQEEGYFRRKQYEALKKLKAKLKSEPHKAPSTTRKSKADDDEHH